MMAFFVFCIGGGVFSVALPFRREYVFLSKKRVVNDAITLQKNK